MARVLVDSSTLIALARIGELELLTAIVGTVHVTQAVAGECLVAGQPATDVLEAFLSSPGATVLEHDRGDDGPPRGLGPGEASLFDVVGPHDALIVDDRAARELALARGVRFTGLLGLIVGAVEEGIIEGEQAVAVVRKLARSDFRMTAELYDWAMARIQDRPAGGHGS